MKVLKWKMDYRLLFGFILAHLLMYFTFADMRIFWYIFTAAMLFLISYSIFNEEIEDKARALIYFPVGILSGGVLFAIFWLGKMVIGFLGLPLTKEIAEIYNSIAPTIIWQYIILILILIPGEEIFWRGFIQKRINKYRNVHFSVFASSLMYASVHIYSGTIILPTAAFVSGLYWGYLFAWKKSLPLLIVSHIIFDLFLFVIYPLG